MQNTIRVGGNKMIFRNVSSPVRGHVRQFAQAVCPLVLALAFGMAGLSLLAPPAMAGKTDALKHYGRGVHAFYAGRYEAAIQQLDLASSYDARDPRIFIFRGLAKQRLGWTYQATADFQMGAQLEAATGATNQLGRALERIQGADRLVLERYRAEAKKLAPELVQNLIPQPIRSPSPPRDSLEVPPQRPILPRVSQSRATFRLASLPEDQTDPFVEVPGTLLGRGKLAPVRQASSEDALVGGAETEPFGTGVASDAEVDAFDGQFAEDEVEAAGGDRPQSAGGEQGKRGVFGAMFRAFSKSVTPDNLPQVPGLAGSQAADQAESSDDPFSDLTGDQADTDGAAGTREEAGTADEEEMFGEEFDFGEPVPDEPLDDSDQQGNPFEDDDIF